MKVFAATLSLLALCLAAGILEAATVSSAGKQFVLAEEPADAADVIHCRKEAINGREIVCVGRIGGRKNPWVKGACAFSLVDRSLVPCNEKHGDNCPTPWDYCCSPNLAQSMVLVMFVDSNGKMVRKDARELLGVKELDMVVIRGKARRDKSGNLTIVASRIFVPEANEAL